MSSCDTFDTEDYTLNDYKAEAGRLRLIASHEQRLRRCVALTVSGYIVRLRDDAGYYYKEVTAKELETEYLKIWRLIDGRRYKPAVDSLQNAEYQGTLQFYDRIELFSNNPRVLSLYVPPSADVYRKDWVETFIHFFEYGRVFNRQSFHEELSAHAYRFRHPSASINKFFVHFSPTGNTGKTLLACVLGSLYPRLSVIGIKSHETKSDYAGWMNQYLNLSFEELDNEEYRNKFFETFLKQSVSDSPTSCRRLYKETVQREFKSIVSMNTNSTDLYGMIRADSATIQRMVVLHFKPAPFQDDENSNYLYWSRFLKRVGLNKTDPQSAQNKNIFAYSLYRYLREEYVNPFCPDLEKWNPDRYSGEDKYKIIADLHDQSKTAPNRFVKGLCLLKYSDNAPLNIVRMGSQRMYFIRKSDFKEAVKSYRTELTASEQKAYSLKHFIEALVRAGWDPEYRTNKSRGYGIPTDKWTFSDGETSTEESESDD